MHQLTGVLALAFIFLIVGVVVVIVISLCVHRRLANNGETTQCRSKHHQSRDKMATAHVTSPKPTPATVNDP